MIEYMTKNINGCCLYVLVQTYDSDKSYKILSHVPSTERIGSRNVNSPVSVRLKYSYHENTKKPFDEIIRL